MQNYMTTKRVFQIIQELDYNQLLEATDQEIEFINTYFPPTINGEDGILIKVESGLLISLQNSMMLLEDMPELSFPSIDSFMLALGSENNLRETSLETSRI